MFGFFGSRKAKVSKATEFVTEAMLPTVGHLRTGPIADELFVDFAESPYHSGYVQGKLSALIGFVVHSGQLPREEANMVSGSVLMSLFGVEKAKAASSAIKQHQIANLPEYQHGIDRGARIATYMAGSRDVSEDPDFARAIESARSVNASYNQLFPEDAGSTENEDPATMAVIGLEMIWFTETLGSRE